MPKSTPIARALTGSPMSVMYEPGLEMPPEMKALKALNSVAAGFGTGQLGGMIAQALAQKGIPALQGLGEAGAIFPEGYKPSLPESGFQLPADMTKRDLVTESERLYRNSENNLKQYLANNDFENALKAKWGLLRNAGGN